MQDSARDSHTAPDPLSLALREMAHRCNNDLQLIVSLLAIQRTASQDQTVRSALEQAMGSVAVFARLRMASLDGLPTSLGEALGKVSDALRHFAEPRFIAINVDVAGIDNEPEAKSIVSVALAVNELVTNAIKHAFDDGQAGTITMRARQAENGDVVIIVEDDGKPLLSPAPAGKGQRLGLDLVQQLMRSAGGRLSLPVAGAKAFELILPMRTIRSDC